MEGLIARVLSKQYPEILGAVDVPFGWFHVVKRAADALRDLHPGLRIGVVHRDHGLMRIDVSYEPAEYPDDILDRVLDIVSNARTLSAWTCIDDGHPGWLVHGRKGPVVLCAECQRKHGITVHRHEA